MKLDQRHGALMTEYVTLRSLHDELCAARDPLRPLSAPVRSRPLARRAHGRLLLAERSAEPSHPDAGPVPTAHAPDRFELLRRARDLVVGLGDAYDGGDKIYANARQRRHP